MVGQSVHTSNDKDLGNIEAVGSDSIEVRRPLLAGVRIHYYYIPFIKTEGWDGNIIWLKISRDQADREYTKHHAPDPTKYYVKERPGFIARLLIHNYTTTTQTNRTGVTDAPSPSELADPE